MQHRGRCVSFDIGGTWTKYAVVGYRGNVMKFSRFATPSRERPAALTELITQTARRLSGAEEIPLCISVAGIVDSSSGIVRQSPNFPLWRDVKLRQMLAGRPAKNVIIENDANCALLAESWLGTARNARNAILLTLGTGVGGACIADGRLVRGASGYASEFGHMTIRTGGWPCSCGGSGHLESYCSISGLWKLAKRQMPPALLDRLAQRAKNSPAGGNDVPRQLFRLARQGNTHARAVWAEFGAYLGAGVASLLNIFNPEVVALGGGISKAYPAFRDSMIRAIKRLAYKDVVNNARVKVARFADEAGVIGAASCAFTHIGRRQ